MGDSTGTDHAARELAATYSTHIRDILGRLGIFPDDVHYWKTVQENAQMIFYEPNNNGVIDAILIYLVKSILNSTKQEDTAEWTIQLIYIALVKGLLSFIPTDGKSESDSSSEQRQIIDHTINSTLPNVIIVAFLQNRHLASSNLTHFRITSLEKQIEQCFNVLSRNGQEVLAMEIYSAVSAFMLYITPHLPSFLNDRFIELLRNSLKVLEQFMPELEQ